MQGLTVSVRRPGREGINATGRGVLSMSGLSHGVVRVDQDNSLTSLTLQDCGQVQYNTIQHSTVLFVTPESECGR